MNFDYVLYSTDTENWNFTIKFIVLYEPCLVFSCQKFSYYNFINNFCNLCSLEIGRMSFAGVSNRQKASRQVTGVPAKTKKPKAKRKPVWDVSDVAFTLAWIVDDIFAAYYCFIMVINNYWCICSKVSITFWDDLHHMLHQP